MNKRIQLFDIAANLTDDQFSGKYHHKQHHPSDIDDVIKRAENVGCQHLLIASGCLGDIKHAIQLCAQSPHFYTTAGIHPCRANEPTKNPQQYWDQLKIQRDIAFKNNKLIAIGECGLDYDRLEWSSKQEQIAVFEPHFQWAQELKLPMYLHNRNTGNDFFDIMHANRHKISGGVVHSFTGTQDELDKILKLDLYVGINGCSLKTQDNLKVTAQVPLDKLMIETDSPYCEIRNTHASSKLVKTQFPSQKPEKWIKGQLVKIRNEPCKIVQVLEVLSELYKMETDKLAEICFRNTLKCFNIVQ